MGHYYAEMACSTCRKITCECPKKADADLNKWIVDSDLSVMLVSTFDEKHRPTPGKWGYTCSMSPWSRRIGRKLFATKEEATEHRLVYANELVEKAKAKLFNAQLDYQIALDKKRSL